MVGEVQTTTKYQKIKSLFGVFSALTLWGTVVGVPTKDCSQFKMVPGSQFDYAYYIVTSGAELLDPAYCNTTIHPNSNLVVPRDVLTYDYISDRSAYSWIGLFLTSNGWVWADGQTSGARPPRFALGQEKYAAPKWALVGADGYIYTNAYGEKHWHNCETQRMTQIQSKVV
jgi:hypothetical protein